MLRWLLGGVGLAALLGVAVLWALPQPDRSAGRVRGEARAPRDLAAREARQRQAARALGGSGAGGERILFGDLHVHTTFSIDALIYSLPLFGGEGAHPPADACDFARWCAAVDFFSLNDHAEGLTPDRWRETLDSVRQCDAAADPADPDLVAYAGWEWTQVGPTPDTHYGHRNVIFRGLADDELPARPITALPDGTMDRARGMAAARVFERLGRGVLGGWGEFLWLTAQMVEVPDCPHGVPSPELPAGCRENASTPAELFEKLEQWALPTLVIPHGLAWGYHAPPGASLATSLAGGNHDPALERLLEVYSGHGNSEEFRDVPDPLPAQADDPDACPAPTRDFLPCCWQAGEIIRARCGDLPAAECEARVREARRLALAAGNQWHRTIPDANPEDWLDCNQCRDCFKPAMTLRPGETAQYGYALRSFDAAPGGSRRFRWGLIASTDTHKARPATGYKQEDRHGFTDSRGIVRERDAALLRPWIRGRQRDPQRAQAVPEEGRGLRSLFDAERVSSFMYPGGIVAVHAADRSRGAIWDALMARRAYGTSGPRILLWFDLVNGPRGRVPMGGEARMARAPEFEVRAVGDFVQRPGCPESSVRALSPERLERLCRGSCYHPGHARHPIVSIEVVRILPQTRPGEPVAPLIQDPWRVLPCEPRPEGCRVRFSDPEFAAAGRDAVYYVRALQEATPAINGDTLRTEFDARGNAVRTRPCYGGWRTPADDDCLAPVRERAWSSPIFVDRAAR